jgi:hypothetical protein
MPDETVLNLGKARKELGRENFHRRKQRKLLTTKNAKNAERRQPEFLTTEARRHRGTKAQF